MGSGCTLEMKDQPRYEPLEESDFFADGSASRPLVEGTVARGHLKTDQHLYEGLSGGSPAETFPFAVTREVLLRGQGRYDIFCASCHSRTGNGKGMVVQRGFTPAPSFHEKRQRDLPPGYLYRVVMNGYGDMPAFADRITARDRWAIVAYIRALQLSQDARLEDVPKDERGKLLGEAP